MIELSMGFVKAIGKIEHLSPNHNCLRTSVEFPERKPAISYEFVGTSYNSVLNYS